MKRHELANPTCPACGGDGEYHTFRITGWSVEAEATTEEAVVEDCWCVDQAREALERTEAARRRQLQAVGQVEMHVINGIPYTACNTDCDCCRHLRSGQLAALPF